MHMYSVVFGSHLPPPPKEAIHIIKIKIRFRYVSDRKGYHTYYMYDMQKFKPLPPPPSTRFQALDIQIYTPFVRSLLIHKMCRFLLGTLALFSVLFLFLLSFFLSFFSYIHPKRTTFLDLRSKWKKIKIKSVKWLFLNGSPIALKGAHVLTKAILRKTGAIGPLTRVLKDFFLCTELSQYTNILSSSLEVDNEQVSLHSSQVHFNQYILFSNNSLACCSTEGNPM